MCKLLRRLFLLALAGGAGYALYTALQARRDEPQGDAPEWPPFEAATAPAAADAPDAGTTDTDTTDAAATETDSSADAGDDGGDAPEAGETPDRPRWVEPVDGQCPDGYPIKGNDDSGIYHVPGGRFYDRTIPERCYADEADAVADGYRRSKA